MTKFMTGKWLTLGGLAAIVSVALLYAFLTATPALACDAGGDGGSGGWYSPVQTIWDILWPW
ncbi:MAG: hypothetical protein GC184_04945 [Rhizobiales bacterium]|nr:hypothetical protein [Hyphomicrobiales bacterium]